MSLHAGRTTPPARAFPESNAHESVAVDPAAMLPVPTPDERALLDHAIARFSAEAGRWAYTQTSRDSGDEGDTVLRFDPSRPDDEQWTPLKLDGKTIDDPHAIARWRKKRAKQMRERRTLGELLNADGARVWADEPAALVFELPLRRDDNYRFPPETFQVLLRVDKASRSLARIDVKARESFRVIGIAKVTAAALAVEFEPVAADYPPLPVRMSGGGSARILFVRVNGSFALTRSEFQRVKPYTDRFSVKVGDLKALDF
ncbi:MAG TPA: hypothetical protein VGD81_18515 [Opitutaceae bacterium]